MQLSIITKLYESETKEKNLVVNLIQLINNLKFLKSKIEERQGMITEFSKNFNDLSYLSNKVGYCLYWVATLGYIHSRHVSDYRASSDRDWET